MSESQLLDDLKYLADAAGDMSVCSFSHPEDVNVAEVAQSAIGEFQRLQGERDEAKHCAQVARNGAEEAETARRAAEARAERALNGCKAAWPILTQLRDRQYNVESWGLEGRIKAVEAALASSTPAARACAAGFDPADHVPDAGKMIATAKAEESAVYPEWRPIETAPKDGTLVDIWVLAPGGKHGRRIADVRWDTNRSFHGGIGRVAQPDAWTDRCGGQVWLDGSVPTHWLPLPTPPKA